MIKLKELKTMSNDKVFIIDDDNLESHHGKFICIYGDSATGKTVNTLATAPDPILWVTTEQRDFKLSVDVVNNIRKESGLKPVRFVLMLHEKFIQTVTFLNDIEKGLNEAGSKYSYEEIQTVFFDGLSFFHNISLPGEIQQFDFEQKKDRATLRSLMRVDLGQKGDSNQAVFRIFRLLKICSGSYGKIVIVSCLETERPKWDQEYEYGPVLGGREVPDNFPGLFDLAGRISHRYKKNKKTGEIVKVYPPMISFDEGKGFWAKYTGSEGRKEGQMNWRKILGAINKKEKKENKL